MRLGVYFWISVFITHKVGLVVPIAFIYSNSLTAAV